MQDVENFTTAIYFEFSSSVFFFILLHKKSFPVESQMSVHYVIWIVRESFSKLLRIITTDQTPCHCVNVVTEERQIL